MNAKNPNGAVGYRTPTPTSNNPTRLLKAERGLTGELSPGQAIITRARLAEMADGNTEPTWEDISERLNRKERRTLTAEAKEHKRALARRDALRKQRADQKAKKFARALVEV
jgi:hypothetical protein